MFCFVDVEGCDVNTMPTLKPTVSVEPTYKPTYQPTTPNPAHTFAPTNSPLDKGRFIVLIFALY